MADLSLERKILYPPTTFQKTKMSNLLVCFFLYFFLLDSLNLYLFDELRRIDYFILRAILFDYSFSNIFYDNLKESDLIKTVCDS